MHLLNKHYRVPLLIPESRYILPIFFSDQVFLNKKTITGVNIDFTDPTIPLVPNPFNFAKNDITVPSNPKSLTAKDLSLFFVTFVNDNDEIIIDNAPCNLFSDYNSNYPEPNTTVISGKKRIVPTNFIINLRKSYIKQCVGPFNFVNYSMSFNFYYK